MAQLLQMFDSVEAAELPADTTCAAGYVDGGYPSFDAIKARFPDAAVISITVLGTLGARMCDCENGAMTYPQAAIWANREVAQGRRPTIYTAGWNRPAIEALLTMPADVDWFLPSWDGQLTVPTGWVGHQYASPTAPPFGKTHGNYDASVVLDTWVHQIPTPPPVPGGPVKQEDEVSIAIGTDGTVHLERAGTGESQSHWLYATLPPNGTPEQWSITDLTDEVHKIVPADPLFLVQA